MSKILEWYLVKIGATGFIEKEATQGLSDLQQELEMRPNLHHVRAFWDNDTKSIIGLIETQSFDSNSAGLGVYDDFFESLIATIDFSSEDGIGVEILSVQKL